jgi:membrane protein implicated in regulation of membrane protease activity
MEYMVWIWLSAAVALFILEMCTTDLVSIWLSIGALLTTVIVAIFPKIPIPWQIFMFIVFSAIMLLLTRKFVKKFLARTKEQATNLELYYDKTAIVVEEIDNVNATGAVKINGLVWTARSENNEIIEKDAVVIFKKIDGNKAIVVRKGE